MAKSKVTEDEVREAAYHKWLADGAPHGKDQEYWFRAEQELGAAPAKKAPARKAAGKATKAAATGATGEKAPVKKAATRKAAPKAQTPKA